MSTKKDIRSVAFTREETRVFKVSVVIFAAIAVGMFVVAPKGLGQVVGVCFAVALAPFPPLVVYLLRRRYREPR